MSAFCCRSTRFLTKLKATLHIPATLSLPRGAWAFAPLAICLAGGSIAGIGQASAQELSVATGALDHRISSWRLDRHPGAHHG
jgi:hypothetical protein